MFPRSKPGRQCSRWRWRCPGRGKFYAFVLTGSAAIFSDALETIVNVVAAAFALYSLSVAHTPADPDHPYGHGKIEFFAGGFEGGMIFLASLFMIAKAVQGLSIPA